MKELMNIISHYGVDVCILALIINLSTGITKTPIKWISKKIGLGNSINKYITLLPLFFGFIYAGLYQLYSTASFLNEKTLLLATTSASLSLAIYAILEKFFQKTVKTVQQDIQINGEQSLDGQLQSDTLSVGVSGDFTPPAANTPENKIILGKKNDETET